VQRHDEARKIYLSSFIENVDILHKIACYHDLVQLTLAQGDHETTTSYIKLAEDIKRESYELSSISGTLQFSQSPCNLILTMKNFQEFPLPMDPHWSLSQVKIDLDMSFLKQLSNLCLNVDMSMMNHKMYSDALIQFKLVLSCSVRLGSGHEKLTDFELQITKQQF
jgi:hypothetical protein